MAYAGNNHPRSLIRKAFYDSLFNQITGIGEKVFIGHTYGFDKDNCPLIFIDLQNSTSDLVTNCAGLRQYQRSLSVSTAIAVSAGTELEAIDLAENYSRQVENLIASPGALIDDLSFINQVILTGITKEQEIQGTCLVVITLEFTIDYNDQFIP